MVITHNHSSQSNNIVYTNKEYEPDKVNKAYQNLGIIKRNYIHLTSDCFILLYQSLVRSQFEYANSVWNTQYIENHKNRKGSNESGELPS